MSANVWITGGTKGIGASLARLYHADGSNVIVSARGRTDDTIGTFIPLDASNRESVEQAMVDLAATSPTIDVAILNAGNCVYMNSETFNASDAIDLMQVNYNANLVIIEKILPQLRKTVAIKGKAKLVLVSSSISYLPLPKSGAYAATKAALTALGEALRYDLANEKIDLHIVSPGFVDTPLTQKNDFSMPFLVDSDEAAAKIKKAIAKGTLDISFPRRLTWIMHTIDFLPARLKTKLLAKMSTVERTK